MKQETKIFLNGKQVGTATDLKVDFGIPETDVTVSFGGRWTFEGTIQVDPEEHKEFMATLISLWRRKLRRMARLTSTIRDEGSRVIRVKPMFVWGPPSVNPPESYDNNEDGAYAVQVMYEHGSLQEQWQCWSKEQENRRKDRR